MSRDRLFLGAVFCFFFPLSRAERSRQSVACPDLISVRRCTPMSCTKHLLRLYRLRRRLQRSPRTGLCGLEIMLYPHTVLFTRMAERAPFASESQVRERGSTREPLTTCVVCTRARARVQSTAMDQGRVPQSFFAFDDAVNVRCSKDRGSG